MYNSSASKSGTKFNGIATGLAAFVMAGMIAIGGGTVRADVIFETDDPFGGFIGVNGFDVFEDQSVAQRFTPNGDFEIDRLSLWLWNNDESGGMPEITITLRIDELADDCSTPTGAVLESWTINLPATGFANPELFVFDSVLNPLVEDGQQYWVAAESPSPPFIDPVWAWASPGNGIMSFADGDDDWSCGSGSANTAMIVEGTPAEVIDISIVTSNPPDGAIDARQPFDLNGENPDGWSAIHLAFDGDVSGLEVGDFELTQQGGAGLPPEIVAVNVEAQDSVELVFSDIIAELAWTTIRHIESDTSVRIGFLPGDVNGDGTASANDVLALIDALNGQTSLPDYSTDIDRSGVSNAADVLREIDLLNGAEAFSPYLGESLPR